MLTAFTLAALLASSAPSGCDGHSHVHCDHKDWRKGLPVYVLRAIARVDDEPAAPPQTRDPRHESDLKADIELGRKYSAEIEKELKLSKNEEAIARVNRIGAELAQIANQTPVTVTWGDRRLNPFEYTFRVVEGEDINAFSIPGGFIYIYEGLIKYAETDDELAGVVAHEISHASFRHLATLRREQSRLDAITLPLILISILSGSPLAQGVGATGQLASQAIGSGWSEKAEKSADYGAVQYMKRSRYSPVGVLTFMERLAFDERNRPQIDWGIFRTHPPTRERANAIINALRRHNIPIERSRVTTSMRAAVVSGEQGVEVRFGARAIHTFGGTEALARADATAKRLNTFFDRVPKLFEVTQGPGGQVLHRRDTLLTVTPEDAAAAGLSVDELTARTVANIKRAIYDVTYRIWDLSG